MTEFYYSACNPLSPLRPRLAASRSTDRGSMDGWGWQGRYLLEPQFSLEERSSGEDRMLRRYSDSFGERKCRREGGDQSITSIGRLERGSCPVVSHACSTNSCCFDGGMKEMLRNRYVQTVKIARESNKFRPIRPIRPSTVHPVLLFTGY